MKESIYNHFKTVDPILYSLIAQYVWRDLTVADNHFISLCREIIGQPLAPKAAQAIWLRFIGLTHDQVQPSIIIDVPEQSLRSIGLSWAKARYIKDLAQKILNEKLHLAKIQQMSDKQVIHELTKVKGIGKWTAEMFLIFSLGREDVFSLGDLGLQRAIQKLYKLKNRPTQRKLLSLSKKWKPYRCYASLILWHSLDNT